MLKMSPVQVHLAIMEAIRAAGLAADADLIDVEPIVMPLTKACMRFCDPKAQLRKEKIAARAEIPPLHILQSMERERVHANVETLWFEHAKSEPKLPKAQFESIMVSERVARYLLSIGLTREDISYALDHADKDGDGHIDRDEFFSFLVDELCAVSREKTISSLEAMGKISQPSAGAFKAAEWVMRGSSIVALFEKVSDVQSLAGGAAFSSVEWLHALREASGMGTEVDELAYYLPSNQPKYDWGAVLCTCRAIVAA